MTYNFKETSVLVVESSQAMFDLIKSVLMVFGIKEVYAAYSTADGFKVFCDHNPDLVIVDWLEDPENGLELTKRIRTDASSPNPFVPVVMMTGYSQKKRILMARDSGITEFMAKPFTAKTLYDRIEQIIEQPRQFVKAPKYFGPDRRRRSKTYDGQERRDSDGGNNDKKSPAQRAKEMHERSQKES